jgi:hypothetical protein
MKHLGIATILVALTTPVALCDCTPQQMQVASDVLGGVSRGAAWLSAALDVAETGAERFFQRHPQQEAEAAISDALHKARLAVAALDATIAAAESLQDPRLEAVRSSALAAYDALLAALIAFGVLDAKATGGAEAETPIVPEPFSMPSRADLETVL